MDFLVLLGIAIGLAMDACAVAVAASIRLGQANPRQVFRFSFHFGPFQALMPVIGWLAGIGVASYIQQWDHWVALGLLTFIGGKALYSALFEREDSAASPIDPTRGWSLVLFSLATSIDALAVGLSFALLRLNIWVPVAVIGVVTALLTILGMQVGARLGLRFGKAMEVLGGIVLIGIGIKILLEHINAPAI